MKDNTFSPSFGNRPSYLVGRDEVIENFENNLASRPGAKGRSLIFLGQRGMGKTVLLWELADRAREQGFVVASPTVVSESMLDRVVEKIQEDGERVLCEKKSQITGASIGGLGFTVGLQFKKEINETKTPQYKLTQLARALAKKDRGLLILVDEVQANSESLKQLIIQYQEMQSEGLDVALAMAGLPACVSSVLNDKVLTFLNRSEKVELGPLKISDICNYFKLAFESSGLKVSATQCKRAAEATYGSPYLMQLIGHNLTSSETKTCTDEMLEQSIALANEDFKNDVCKTTLAPLSDKDIAFLTAMSEDESTSNISDIASRLNVKSDYAQKYKKRLLNAGVIEVASRGSVRFAVPLLREFLIENREC